MNLIKHRELFDPTKVDEPVHIIGCGAIGSHLAELLTRLGLNNFKLYDFDTVEDKNLANQLFLHKHIGKAKVLAVAEQIQMINPTAKITVFEEGYTDQQLNGYVFLAVDSIELRRSICIANKFNNYIKAIFDFRMRLTDAQHYAANWKERDHKLQLLKTMEFTSDEAQAATPTNACGSTLSIIPTVKIVTATGVANFINFVNGYALKQTILIDAFTFNILPM